MFDTAECFKNMIHKHTFLRSRAAWRHNQDLIAVLHITDKNQDTYEILLPDKNRWACVIYADYRLVQPSWGRIVAALQAFPRETHTCFASPIPGKRMAYTQPE